MFIRDGILFRSTLLHREGICHGFSTREGGVSTHPYTASMNLVMGREDSDETVRQNGEIFAGAVTYGAMAGSSLVTTSQIHSAIVRTVDRTHCGEGLYRETGVACDGFVTDTPGVLPMIRVADCTPILLLGYKADQSPVVGAVHAGWRGSAAGIAAEAVEKMVSLGCVRDSICAAVGPHIGVCCYEVGEDLLSEVQKMAGSDFGSRYVTPRHMEQTGERKYTADLTGMNLYWLETAGVKGEKIDVSPACTMCQTTLFHSHRATCGKRGAMGAAIGILQKT